MEDKKHIIILSGPVGAGKTTVAKALTAALPGPLAYIEGDLFWSFIAKGAGRYSDHTNLKMIMRAMTAAATHYAVNGYAVLLDFSIPPWFLKTTIAVARFKSVPLDYIVLNPGEAVCAARAAERSEGRISDYTHFHELYLSFADAGSNSIQNDKTDVAATAEQICNGLQKGIFSVSL